jgi:hypothetical protein
MPADIGYDGSTMSTPEGEAKIERWLRALFRAVAVLLGALHGGIAATRQSMNADGISYLDMGDAYLRGDWEIAINAIWSPLYAWIVGGLIAVAGPPIDWEFPAVHLINFGIYVVALICFEFFWRRLTVSYYGETARRDAAGFPRWIWISLGYALFIWTSLSLIEIWAVTPDMCVAALVFLAAGLLLQIRSGRAGVLATTAFGVVLALGYLAKAAMFPLGIAGLVIGVLVQRRLPRAAVRMVPAIIAFFVLSGSFIWVLSSSSGHLTFGDVSRFAYLKHVNQIPYPHWSEDFAGDVGTPVHPIRRVLDDPVIYEFAEPIGGTYPMSYDPGYWTEGLTPNVDVGQQSAALIYNGVVFFELFIRQQGAFLATALLLFLMSLGLRSSAGPGAGEWGLIAWAVTAFGLYGLVFVEPRYIGAFVVLFWAGVLSFVRCPRGGAPERLLGAGGIMLALFVFINIAAFNLDGLGALLGVRAQSEAQESQFTGGPSTHHPEVAHGLIGLGLERGSRVGLIGYSFDASWARLARLKIVAEILPEEAPRFWSADPARQSEALAAFADAGARAVVAEPYPAAPQDPGWRPVGKTGYRVYIFP